MSHRPKKRLTSLSDRAEAELPGNFFERPLQLGEHNPLFGPSTEVKDRLTAYEDLLRMATFFSVPTIAAMVREHGSTRGVTEERVEDRIQEGIEMVAEKYEVRIKHVRREFERARDANLRGDEEGDGAGEFVPDGEGQDCGIISGDIGFSSGDVGEAITCAGEDAEVLAAATALMNLKAESEKIMDQS